MRKIHSKSKIVKVGTTRIDGGFLFIPKSINDETRWLEYARWQETFQRVYTPDTNISPALELACGLAMFDWVPTSWIDAE